MSDLGELVCIGLGLELFDEIWMVNKTACRQ
jgi:hypothetical protein